MTDKDQPEPKPQGVVRRNNTVVKFIDQYGDEREIYRCHGQALRIKKKQDSPSHLLNRAAAVIVGQKIRAARRAAGLSPTELLDRAGLAYGPSQGKERMYEIEKAGTSTRNAMGVRFGTLYAIALALDLEVTALLPTTAEVQKAAGLTFATPSPRLSRVQAAE